MEPGPRVSHCLTVEEVQLASETWGANCGPGAIAAVLGLPIDQVRGHIPGFDEKRYTSPTMMQGALRSLGVSHGWRILRGAQKTFPKYGLARVQWVGPWMKYGVPAAARYRHTHWIAASAGDRLVFDVNCVSVNGGWIPLDEWAVKVVPWLLKQCEPKATGEWFLTHQVEIPRQAAHV